MNNLLPLITLTAAAALIGCVSTRHPQPTTPDVEPATRPTATDVDPKTATPDYWLDQPAAASVTSADFDHLFNAAQRVARTHYFNIDQADRRAGLIVSAPETTKQFFEVWRNDSGTAHGTFESSLTTTRRTLRYEFTRNADNTFTVTPKVLVERYASVGRRVSVTAMAGAAFDPPAEEGDPAYRHYPWDPTYWYPVGRDTALEKQIAASIQSRVKS